MASKYNTITAQSLGEAKNVSDKSALVDAHATAFAQDTETKRGMAKKSIIPILIALLIAAGGIAYYFYRQTLELKQNPQKIVQEEVDEVVNLVARLMVLPEGEKPTLATVTDPLPLKEQPFFAKAKTGDRVLIYTNARKAILYNPETNKIVEVAPLNIGPAPNQ